MISFSSDIFIRFTQNVPARNVVVAPDIQILGHCASGRRSIDYWIINIQLQCAFLIKLVTNDHGVQLILIILYWNACPTWVRSKHEWCNMINLTAVGDVNMLPAL